MGRRNTILMESFNSQVQEIITKSVANCSSSVQATTGLDISGNGNTFEDIDVSQQVQFDVQCFNESSNRNKLIADVATGLVAKIDQENKGLLAGLTGGRTNTTVSIHNEVRDVFTSDDTLNCINNIVANNVITVSGDNNTFRRIKTAQVVSGIVSCVMSRLQEMETISSIVNQADAEVKQKNTGVEIPNPFAAIGNVLAVAVGIGILFVIGFIYLIAKLIGSLF